MNNARAAATAVNPLITGFVDDAGLFPPEELPMAAALTRYAADVDNPVLNGRFLCPAARIAECVEAIPPGRRVRLGLISALGSEELAAALAQVRACPTLELASVEGLLPADLAVPDSVRSLPCYAELRADEHLAANLEWLRANRLGAKVRCGGIRADLFPSVEELAAFVVGCAQRKVPFKATAGLHHAIAHVDPVTGFSHHGFLNLLMAAARAGAGGSLEEVAGALRTTGAASLVAEARALSPDAVAATRSLFHCYGSCSTSEPYEDLRTLGLLEAPA